MSVNNSLARKPIQDKQIEYQVNGETVRLSPSIVRQYLVSGNGNVTDQEVVFFLNMCKYQKLNPLTKDAHLVKYGSQPATIIVGKDALLKRAMNNPRYAGHQAGVIVRKSDGTLEYRIGSMTLNDEELVGGWAKTHVKGYEIPIEASVSLREYIGTKGDGTVNSMWAGKPGTMIRKVALVTSLKEAFPDDLGSLYTSEEMNIDLDETAPAAPVEIPDAPMQDATQDYPDQDPAGQQATMDELPGGF